MAGRALRNPSPKQADRALARYVRSTVYPYSGYYRELLDRDGLGRSGIRGRGDLVRLEPTALAAVPDPSTLVLRPDRSSMQRLGSRGLWARSLLARLLGIEPRFNRLVIETRFKPVHWLLCDGVPIGYSMADLSRLGGLGSRWLSIAGITDRDVLVSLLPSGPSVAHWQVVQGARSAGVAAAHLAPGGELEQLVRLVPSAVIGHPADLIRVLGQARDAGLSLPRLTTVLCVAEGAPPGAGQRAAVEALTGAAVVLGWAPPGVRSLWTECRQGAAAADSGEGTPLLHTWPGTEVLEVSGEGELLWTAVGWHGSVLLRLRTGAYGALQNGTCPHCGIAGVSVRPAWDPSQA